MTEALPARPFAGLVYRAHNPRWAYAPTSGEGAARHGGRFNPRGTHALYTSLDPKTARMEAQQGMPFKAQPLTLVAYRVDCERVVDLTEPRRANRPRRRACNLGLSLGRPGKPGPDPTHLGAGETSDRWRAPGRPGAQLRPGHGPDDRNLVLWRWSDEPPCRVHVIDDFGRLPKDDASRR